MMERKLKVIEGVIIYLDDILILTKSLSELENRTRTVQTALKLNLNLGERS